MKHTLLLLAVLLLVIGVNSAISQTKSDEVRWAPMVGYKGMPGYKYYYDAASRERRKVEDKDLAFILILITSDKFHLARIDNKNVAVKSIAQAYIVECTKELYVPVSEFYFDIEKPNRSTRPVGGGEYGDDVSAAELANDSELFKLACPEFL